MTNAITSGPDPEPRAATTGHPGSRHSTRRPFRRVLAIGGTVVLVVMTFAGLLVAGALVTNRGLPQTVPTSQSAGFRTTVGPAETAVNRATARRGRPVVVAFAAGEAGTVASDLLAPYDIFASSPAFHTYVVAAHARPVPLEGGPALLPTHTFADVDADPSLTPDLVVVPALSKPTGSTEAVLRRWVTIQHDDGARILGVCAGSVVLADTGMLDGLHATSHWSRIDALHRSRLAVHWVTGRRWVEDGSVTTTAAVTSGVPAALHLVAELAGAAEARRVASLHPELGWSPHQTTAITKDHFAVGDWPVGLNFVEPWFRPTVGIALNDGVGELDATAAFEVYTQSAAAETVALGTGGTVRTRHGLILLSTGTRDAPSVSRIVVPGAEDIDPLLRKWADDRHVSIEPLRPPTALSDGGRSGGGFTSALQNLAEHTDATTAASTAKMVGYPTTDLDLHEGHLPVRAVLLGVAGLMGAVVVGLVPASVIRQRRRRAVDSAPTR